MELWDSKLCNPMGMPADLGKLLLAHHSETFICPNCLASRHQCFVCKKLGSTGEGGAVVRSAG